MWGSDSDLIFWVTSEAVIDTLAFFSLKYIKYEKKKSL